MEFTSVEQAVKFAFNMAERVEYSNADPLRVRGTSQDRMGPLDLHAEAALIVRQINRLHPVERDSVLAQYARGRDRVAAVRGLAKFMSSHVAGVVPSLEDIELVILHWATKRPSIRAIAEDRGVSYRKVCSWRTAVLRQWVPVQCRAIERLHQAMFVDGDLGLKG